MAEHENADRARAERIFKARERLVADAPRATADYYAAQQKILDRTQELRRLRLAREAQEHHGAPHVTSRNAGHGSDCKSDSNGSQNVPSIPRVARCLRIFDFYSGFRSWTIGQYWAGRMDINKSSNITPSAKTVAAVEKLARSDRRLAARAVQWDAHPWLLTTGEETSGATFDLRTGSDRPPEASDYITKKTACGAAPPGTPHPLFSAFLNRRAADTELQQFLQRYIGYCLSGFTTEHVFVFGHGTGANGKGTFLNTIQSIFACRCASCRGAGDTKRTTLGRSKDKSDHWRRHDLRSIHAPGFLRLHSDVQNFRYRKLQTHTVGCRRGHAPPALAGAILSTNSERRTRSEATREAEDRVACDLAVGHRRLLGMAGTRTGAARERARSDGAVFRRTGCAQAVA
jgi:D5 N terminal like